MSTIEIVAVGFTPVGDNLYREIILEHYRYPRHKEAVDPADPHVAADDPLCGDEIDLSWRLGDNGAIEAVGVTGKGCSISHASASMLCESVMGLAPDQARGLTRRFRRMLLEEGASDDLGDLKALQGGGPTQSESSAPFLLRMRCSNGSDLR